MLGLRRLSERLGLRPTPLGRFIKLTAASGLVTPDNLASALNEFKRTKVAAGTDEQTVAAFSNYLVDRGKLTRWQCDKLRDGRYKGFYLDEFRLLAHVRDERECSVYLAADTATEHRVYLHVTPQALPAPDHPHRVSSGIRYRVVEIDSG